MDTKQKSFELSIKLDLVYYSSQYFKLSSQDATLPNNKEHNEMGF